MDHFVDERDYKILDNDKYTFFVLRRVMGGKCELLLTDHERLIICLTSAHHPVWVWTSNDASEEEMEKAYKMVSEHSLLNSGYRFNMRYELANYFIERAKIEGIKLSVAVNMYAYECLSPRRPTKLSDGELYRCDGKDIDELTDFIYMFYKETGSSPKVKEDCRLDAKTAIDSGNMFFLKNKEGNSVSCCKIAPNVSMASVSTVYTHPDFRRRHYAENLVYQVTEIIKSKGSI